jgi:hypothetical protein
VNLAHLSQKQTDATLINWIVAMELNNIKSWELRIGHLVHLKDKGLYIISEGHDIEKYPDGMEPTVACRSL